jgi:hypothetical protein
MRVFAQTQNRPHKQVSSSFARSNTANGPNHLADFSLHLQRTIGNQALLRMLQTRAEAPEVELTGTASARFGHDFRRVPGRRPAPEAIQIKPAINQPGDKFEQEADRVSERVMRMPQAQRQGACACGGACPKCQTEQPGQEQELLQARRLGSGDPGPTAVPPMVHAVLRAPGQPLDPATRAFMEPRFGHDFAKVRVHTNNHAAESAAAVSALAYTVGNHVVFGAGQYAPGSSRGQRLLTHELAHVVQQNGGRTSRSMATGRYDISGAPISLMTRKGPLSDAEEQEEERKKEAAKKAAIERHTAQQRKVATFLDNAREIKPNTKKGLRDPNNLMYNTVGLLDGGKLTLTVLSPTPSSPNLHFDTRVRFDSQSNKSPIGGDYPAVPRDGVEGVVKEDTHAEGKVNLPAAPPSPPSIQTLPPKVERAPGETTPAPEKSKPARAQTPPPTAAAQFSPGDIFLFTRGRDITEAQFKNTFVHEGQHIADLSPNLLIATTADEILESYKSEFRAFWIQPPRPRTSELAPEPVERLPEPAGKADNLRRVTISKPDACKICKPANASAPSEVKTELKNPRQEVIFWHIMANYPTQQYDCCYVYDENFRKEVNRFAYPESVNLINSVRLMNLNLELQKLNQSMTLSQVKSTNFVALLTTLDTLDWAFLNDPKLSKPFWDALKAAAPEFVSKGVKALLKKGTRKPVPEATVNKALSGK